MGSASTYDRSEWAAHERVVLVLCILGFLRWARPGTSVRNLRALPPLDLGSGWGGGTGWKERAVVKCV